MKPDMLTQSGDFISSELGYKLHIYRPIGSDDYELIYHYQGMQMVLCKGTKDACREEMWNVVVTMLENLPDGQERPKIVSLGPELPAFAIPTCESCRAKRKRIQNLVARVETLSEKAERCAAQFTTAREELNAMLHALEASIRNMDTSQPSVIPQISFMGETATVNIDTVERLRYRTTLCFEQDIKIYLIARVLKDRLAPWSIVVNSGSTQRVLKLKWIGTGPSASGSVRYFYSDVVLMQAGESVHVYPSATVTECAEEVADAE